MNFLIWFSTSFFNFQNDKVTKLKIENNPFAKGFRLNGQSKRKRLITEESEMDAKTRPSPQSSPSSNRTEDDRISCSSSPESVHSQNMFPNTAPLTVSYRCPTVSSLHDTNINPYYSSIMSANWYHLPMTMPYWNYRHPQYQQYCIPPSYLTINTYPPVYRKDECQPRKLTDFSIDEILQKKDKRNNIQ